MVVDRSSHHNMPSELFSLKWNKHYSTLVDVLYHSRDQESFVDVTLACGGKLYPAHKFILSTCSDYFRDMFKRNPCKHPIVYLNGVPKEDLEALLDYMYRGHVEVVRENLTSLMKTAEGLQIKGLGLEVSIPQPTPPPRQPPPEPSTSPPLKRKKFCEDYLPMGALNMFYNMHNSIPETNNNNSPYDLSRKTSFAPNNSVSQSEIPAYDRPNSTSPPDLKPIESQQSPDNSDSSRDQHCRTSTPSYYHQSRKEDSYPEDMKRSQSSPPPRTPQPTSSSSSDSFKEYGKDSFRDSCRDSHTSRDDDASVPGPSGIQSSQSDDEMTPKEEIKVDDTSSPDSGREHSPEGYRGPDCSDSGYLMDLSSRSRSDSFSGRPSHPSPSPSHLSPHQWPHQTSAPPTPASSTSLGPSRLPWPQDPASGEEMLTCPVCGKMFSKKRKSNLQVHLRTHTNERPFKCSTCSRGFKQKAHLEKHQEKSCHIMPSEFHPYPFFPKAAQEFRP